MSATTATRIIIFNTMRVDPMTIYGDQTHWDSFVHSPEFTTSQQYWLKENDYTYFGDIKDASPHGFGRMEYKNGDWYEGHWEGGFMTEGEYKHLQETFIGTFFPLSDCPREGILSDGGYTPVHIKCTEAIEITDPVCWEMLHGLRDGVTGKKYSTKPKKVVSAEEVKEWLFEPKKQEEIKRITQFKAKYITSPCNEIPVTVLGQPVVIFLCSQSALGTSTCSENSKEFIITTNIPSLPIRIEVYLWSKAHLEAQINNSPKTDVFYDKDRKIGELQFADAIKTTNTLQLNLKNSPFVTHINLEFTLLTAEEGAIALTPEMNLESFSLGPLLATLKTYT